MGDDFNDGSYHGFSMAFARARVFDRFILRYIRKAAASTLFNLPMIAQAALSFPRRMCATTQKSFAADELSRALTEQSFGITSYRLETSASTLLASAVVTLLEGKTIRITLTSQGYHIENAKQGETYESLDQLLQAASPLYTQQAQAALISRLSRIA
ncbi:hypothetical protein EYR40_009289 [Pleurotus pulmonarius]|nr:hypothetical protein EYR36_005340 [Pleurotus pulmonarius]KAF4590319.1 hypothetical protein EYR38_009618 [Pleurotus pulmonarius]KAF4590693.1 hypothetical protein EYR40_009289 [Pleurotus pulmonarius]